MNHLRLTVCGYPVLFVHDLPVVFRCRKHLALFVRLAVEAGRAFTREYLVEMLWPNVAFRLGNHSLAQALSTFKKALGPGDLTITRGIVSLRAGVVAIDTTGEWPFCDGFEITVSPEFDDWVYRRRAAGFAVSA